MRRSGLGPDLLRQAGRLQSDLDVVRRKLADHPDELLRHAFPRSDRGLRPAALIGDRDGLDEDTVADFDRATQEQRRHFLEAGAQGIDKVARDGEQAQLEPAEEIGLEAIIRFTARPAILIRDGDFDDPASPWQELSRYRAQITETARSVGRIQVTGIPEPYAGTGFLVARDVVMTNCHVARLFGTQGSDRKWAISDGLKVSVDFADNPDVDPPKEFAVSELVGIHQRLDLALLRIDVEGSDQAASKPLVVASGPREKAHSQKVFVLGYPAPDPRNDPAVMRQIFGDIYYVKRLQPGEILAGRPGPVLAELPCSGKTADGDVLYHDASTLGGNSGSCVVNLETNQLVGLHYAGLYTKYNQAVALSTLAEDPFLAAAGVNFG